MDFSLLEFVPDAIVVADDQGAIVYANAMTEQLFGWSRDELVGQAVEVLLPARHRNAHTGLRRGYHEAPRPRPMGLGVDLAALRKDGSEFPAEISLSPLRSGETTWAVAAVRDATERRRIESKALLYRQAKEEVRARDEFLSVASHELRTPVTALHVQLQMLQRVVDRIGAPGPVKERVESLDRQVRRLASLVEALLDLSRIRLGRMELSREPVDLAILAREVAAPYQADLDLARGSSVRVLAPQAVVASLDRVRLEQVLGNLLGNAVKFGEGKPIEIRVERSGGTVQVEVVDRGVGIDADQVDRIFGRFERAAPAQHYPGLGLGLYVAREIVEAHGGKIRVQGKPGQGASFLVELPRVTVRRVLVVADDLGYDPAIDEGILAAHRDGVVTATSALVDGPFAAAALAGAPRSLAVGLHLRLPPGTAAPVAEEEIRRQLDRFLALRGQAPSHVDGHRHVHAEPEVLAALLRIAGPLRLRVRALDSAMRDRIRAAGALACDAFLGDAGLRPCWTPERLAAAAGDLPSGATEIMIHPGHAPTHVQTGFGVEREIELAAAVDPRVREAFRAAGALLCGVLPE